MAKIFSKGLIHVDKGSLRLSPGMVVVIQPNEVHWFENDTQSNFSFVEFWAPPPKETVWITGEPAMTAQRWSFKPG